MKKSRLQVTMPVRRKLLAGSCAYLAGIYAAQVVCLSETIAYIFCALFLCVGVYRSRHRRSALLFVMAALFLLGNGRTANQLGIRDEATQPGVMIEGTVWRVESDTRVYLNEVVIDGEIRLLRPAAVTLMQEKDEDGNPVGALTDVQVGQKIRGTGRLFEQQGKRNPGGVDWRVYALCKGYDLSGYILPGWDVEGAPRTSHHEMFRQARITLSARIEELFGDHAPLFQAVVIGDKSQMDDELVDAMRLTGIVHILTISGMHMSLAALALNALFSRLHIRRKLRFLLQAALLGGFAGLTGMAVGTIRAYIMAMLRELAALTGRKYEPLTALGAASLVMLLIQPLWGLSTSFQFSFFIVLGILLLSRQLAVCFDGINRFPAWMKRLWQTAALSLSAQLAAMPMQLMYDGYVPLLSLPMNLIAGLFMPIIMLGGWAVLGISVFGGRLASALAQALGAFAGALESMSVSAASLPWGIARLPAPCGLTVIVLCALLFMLSRQVFVGRWRKRCCAVLTLSVFLLYGVRFNPAFRYVQLDVGQGDGAVLRKGRKAVLIDVGPEGEQAVLRYLRHEGLFVELVILTHADEDHAGALGALLDSEISLNRIALPSGALEEADSPVVQEALNGAQGKGIHLELYEKGDVIKAGEFALSVLSPDESCKGSNERSLVLYTEIEGMKLLTLGDLPEKCEMDSVPECDVLKVAHHGSRYATSKKLLDQALPKTALISVGRNSYGHPTDRVLEDLMDIGAEIFRTDQSGCITVSAGERGCEVHTYLEK